MPFSLPDAERGTRAATAARRNGGEAIAKLPPTSTGLRITLDGYPGPTNVGILMAEELGYFDDVGLDNLVSKPFLPTRPVRYVAEGLVDVSISHPPQVALAQEKGMPIVAISSVVSRPTAAMIWLEKSKIHSVSDLKGGPSPSRASPFRKLCSKRCWSEPA